MGEIILSGYIKEGLRIASGLNPDPNLKLNNTISLQKPFFRKAGIPRIGECHNGTINLDIYPQKLQIIQPDYEVTCEWVEGVTETFWFVEVLIDYEGSAYEGYIYYPCPSPVKNHDDNIVELLSYKIPRISYGDKITIRTLDHKIKLQKVSLKTEGPRG